MSWIDFILGFSAGATVTFLGCLAWAVWSMHPHRELEEAGSMDEYEKEYGDE